MGMVDFSIDEHVALVTLNSGENRFNPEFLSAFLETIDRIETETDARTLIVSSSHEKIFSNGIDLEWLLPVIQQGESAKAKAFFRQLNQLFQRVLTSPLITVAAITGHAFAGGAILACAFDFRFMRADRGYFCFPEVDLKIPFLPGMLRLLQKAIPWYKFEEMQLTGVRLTARECEEHHIIRRACPSDELLPASLAFAKGIRKDRDIVAEMKRRTYPHIVHALEVEDTPYIESGFFRIE